MKEGRIYKFRQQKIENRTANRGKKSNKQCMKARLQHLQWRLKLVEAASRDTCFANFPADLLDSPFRYFVWLIKLTFSLLVIITVHVLKENRTKSDLSLWFRWNRWNYCKFHRFLSPFPSKFPDLNFAPYVPYIYSCYMTPVSDTNCESGLSVPGSGWMIPGRGGATSRKIVWGCASRFLKPLPYLRPKSVIFLTLFQTWSKVWYPISAMARDRSTGQAVTARTRLAKTLTGNGLIA